MKEYHMQQPSSHEQHLLEELRRDYDQWGLIDLGWSYDPVKVQCVFTAEIYTKSLLDGHRELLDKIVAGSTNELRKQIDEALQRPTLRAPEKPEVF
jgi:hypothetical protein